MADGGAKMIVTKYREHTVCARYVGFKMTDLTVIRPDRSFRVGDIVIGKVTTVRPQINAAFISLGNGPDAYLSLDDPHDILYTRGNPATPLCPGDEILVQVSREAHGEKNLSVSANLMFAGKYIILMTGKPVLGVSAKIPEKRKKELRHFLAPLMPEGFGVIVRSAAETASGTEITQELSAMTQAAEEKLSLWKLRTCFSVTERGPDDAEDFIGTHLRNGINEIVTDLPEEYARFKAFSRTADPSAGPGVRLYDSSQPTLGHVYSLESQIEKALSKKVWLSSGAWLSIEETEAMTVIDVNSGKAISDGKRKKGGKREAVLKINEEAAREIAHQIRLRNLSGIIVTDFIDMKSEEDRQKILKILREDTADDPAGVHVVDMTALQLCEMTRKRRKMTLKEQISLDGASDR